MSGLIAPATLEQIRAASDIVDVIGGYFPLKRAGANFVALCPFHKEKTPSFSVNPHRQIFHCFGCHKGGDVFAFVRDYENLPFVDAVKRLAERANIPLEFGGGPGQDQARHLKEKLLDIHEQITRRWQNCLANEAAGQPARDYLRQRGLSQEAVTLFRLGCAPESWDDTVNWAKSKSYDLPLLEQAGLVLHKEEANRYYDRFRGRLIFPICDEQSRVIGFSGRLLDPEAKTAKYVNSPETAIFKKGKVFFGLDKSKRALLDAGCAIVCEGQLDLIACFMAGVQHVVAPQGTALTVDHARILKRYVEEVILCFDADNAGQSAAVRALDGLLEAGLAVRVAVIPEPHDPDSYIRSMGPDAFRQRIDQAEGFFDYLLKRLCAQHNPATDKGRLQVLQEMAEAVYKTHNQVLIETYAQKTAQRLGVSSESVRTEFKKLARHRPESTAPREEAPTTSAEETLARPAAAEWWLLKIMFLQEDLVVWVAEHIDLQWIAHPQVRRIVALRLEAQRNQTWRGLPAFLDVLQEASEQRLVTEAASEQRVLSDLETTLKGQGSKRGTLEELRNNFCERELSELQRLENKPELAVEEMRRIKERKDVLRQMRKQPLAGLASA